MFTIRTLIGNIRRAYQRAVYQVDEKIRNGWGLDDYVVCLIQEVKIFCERDLEYLYECSENNIRRDTFIKTLELIKEWEEFDEFQCLSEDERHIEGKLFINGLDKKDYLLKKASTFIMEHQGWYWN